MSATAVTRADVYSAAIPGFARAFLYVLAFVLAGYALFGRSFAYIGFPPLYIGEIALLFGIVTALVAGNLVGAVLNLPGLTLALLLLWTAFRTVPYWKEYGFDAPRDGMIVFYGLFAFIIAALILNRPAALVVLFERYKRFITGLVFLSPVVLILATSTPLLMGFGPKVGDLSCHLSAVFALALIGLIRLRLMAVVFILLTELLTFTQGREAMLAFIVGCLLASLFSVDRRALHRLGVFIAFGAVAMAVLAATNVQFSGDSLRRPISVRQSLENMATIFSGGSSEDETKEWRLNWWSDIINYTVHGQYFWVGKGFGPNLADLDGYQTTDPRSDTPPLRSPHNSHMTVLARGGVPALVLWVLALGSWLFAVVRQLLEARRLHDDWWAGVFGFLVTYWTMIVIASSFDVALEGPVLGIWFWTLHGIGLAAAIVHRHRAATLPQPRHAPTPAIHPSWSTRAPGRHGISVRGSK